MSSRVRAINTCGVAAECAVDRVGQSPFEAAHGLFVALPRGALSPVVGTAWPVVPDLADGHDVQAAVELAAPGAGRTVSPEETSIGAVPV